MCGIGGIYMVGKDLVPTDATVPIFKALDDRSKPQLGRCLALAGMLMNSNVVEGRSHRIHEIGSQAMAKVGTYGSARKS